MSALAYCTADESAVGATNSAVYSLNEYTLNDTLCISTELLSAKLVVITRNINHSSYAMFCLKEEENPYKGHRILYMISYASLYCSYKT